MPQTLVNLCILLLTARSRVESILVIRVTFILVIVTSTTLKTTEEPRAGRDFCFLENFEARCPAGLQVSIIKAELGRMRLGKCITKDNGYVGCHDIVTEEVQMKCKGLETCIFHVSSLGPSVLSCPGNRMSFLYVEHECLPGMFEFVLPLV